MKKIKIWIFFGVILSALWVSFVTEVYFDELVNYPSNAAYLGFYDYFGWVNRDGEQGTVRYILLHGDDLGKLATFPYWVLDNVLKLIFGSRGLGGYKAYGLTPTFSVIGFFKIALLPVIIAWLTCLAWIRRRPIFIKLVEVWMCRRDILVKIIEVLNQIYKYLGYGFVVKCAYSGFVLGLFFYFLGFSFKENLVTLVIALIAISWVWVLAKSAIYELVYVVVKAIKDAKR